MLKSICQSRKLAELETDSARLLYTWLIPNLDINGCFSADAVIVKSLILTRLEKTADEVEYYLNDMARVGLICLYDADGDKYLQVPDFADKQPSLNPSKEAKPRIPLPTPDQLQSNSRLTLPKVKESEVKQSEEKVNVNNSYTEIKDYWNSKGNLPAIRSLTKSRCLQLAVRLKESGFESQWRKIIDIVSSTPFCCGKNDRGWTANFDWLIKNDSNYTKVLEGAYGGTKPQPKTADQIQEEQWNKNRSWVEASSLATLQGHSGFMDNLKNPKYRLWAIGINDIVREIQI